MATSKYDINFYKLAVWLTPRWLRKSVFLICVQACIYPLVLIHNAFIRYRNSKLYEIRMNYQVCYMEAFLNDRFDKTLRRIYIDDATLFLVAGDFAYTRDEARPLWLYERSENTPLYLYTRGERAGNLSYDFIIFIPYGVVYDEAEVRAMVRTKLCGKRYKIEQF